MQQASEGWIKFSGFWLPLSLPLIPARRVGDTKKVSRCICIHRCIHFHVPQMYTYMHTCGMGSPYVRHDKVYGTVGLWWSTPYKHTFMLGQGLNTSKHHIFVRISYVKTSAKRPCQHSILHNPLDTMFQPYLKCNSVTRTGYDAWAIPIELRMEPHLTNYPSRIAGLRHTTRNGPQCKNLYSLLYIKYW